MTAPIQCSPMTLPVIHGCHSTPLILLPSFYWCLVQLSRIDLLLLEAMNAKRKVVGGLFFYSMWFVG
jgi:hypothetical protein